MSAGKGPSQLTKESIDVAIESDETIRGAPKVSVVCSNVKFKETDSESPSTFTQDDDKEDVVYSLSRFESNRMGYDGSDAALEVERNAKCGDAEITRIRRRNRCRAQVITGSTRGVTAPRMMPAT